MTAAPTANEFLIATGHPGRATSGSPARASGAIRRVMCLCSTTLRIAPLALAGLPEVARPGCPVAMRNSFAVGAAVIPSSEPPEALVSKRRGAVFLGAAAPVRCGQRAATTRRETRKRSERFVPSGSRSGETRGRCHVADEVPGFCGHEERLAELECPGCHARHWFLSSGLVRGGDEDRIGCGARLLHPRQEYSD